MPKERSTKNGFTSAEVARISGISLHMVHYLARHEYLVPFHPRQQARGAVRYYSYRDLVTAKLIKRLMEAGVQLKRLKQAVEALKRSSIWTELGRDRAVPLMLTDGADVLIPRPDGSLLQLGRGGGQLAFAFLINASRAKAEVLEALPVEKRAHFTLENETLIMDDAPLTTSSW